MGSVYEVSCRCGFQAEVTVGGARDWFHDTSYFPFHCKSCGLVQVNVAKVPDEVSSCDCPECGTADCTQYGTPPVSRHDLRPKSWPSKLLKKAAEEPSDSATIAWGNRQAALKEHLCPACKEMSMEFSRFPSVMFD